MSEAVDRFRKEVEKRQRN